MSKRAALIVDRLGADNAATLSRIAGGTRLHVPGQVGTPATGGRDGFERLARLVGQPLAILLVLHFGDSRLYVPTARSARPVDGKVVARLTRKGWSASRIARKLGCSDRTVHAKRATTATTRLISAPQRERDDKPP